ncbi:MAG: 30S ribosomal protein S6 [Minisyncoccia bacterium]
MRNSKGEKEGSSVYEIGYLVLPSIPEDKLGEVVDSIRKVFVDEGGVEIDQEAPFSHPLAYSISKTVGASRYVVSDAYLGWIKFEVESAKITTIKASIDKIGEVLRFLLVKAPRETTFTFAKAKALVEEKIEAEEKEETPTPSLAEEVVVN